MSDERVRTGGCTCGAVRYEVRGEPFRTGICHCTKCRKETGTVAMAYADWKPEQFSYTGEIRTFEGRSFCPVCGSRLFNLSPDYAELKLGSLDDAPTDIVPAVEGWIKRREPWLAPVLHTGQFREDPDWEQVGGI